MITTVATISQIIIALGICNVWLLRTQKATAWRGGDAKTMEEEFHVYGLSTECMKKVKVCKLTAAAGLIVGLWAPMIAFLSALVMASLMLTAVLMHIRVKDAAQKSLPAATLLVLSIVVAVANSPW